MLDLLLCYMKGFCELLSWVSTMALIGMRCLINNTWANRVAIVSSVITKIFLTLCNAWTVTFKPVPYRHRGGRIKKINAWYLNTHMVYL
jgi:hypothetical protein